MPKRIERLEPFGGREFKPVERTKYAFLLDMQPWEITLEESGAKSCESLRNSIRAWGTRHGYKVRSRILDGRVQIQLEEKA